jgi:CRP/FNR family cyclic AMP-dependent transcriptional regulator
MKDIEDLIREHPFFEMMDKKYLELISGCGKNVHFNAGKYIAEENDPADTFYVLRKGMVRIEIKDASRGYIPIQTVCEGNIVGWTWIFPPYRWEYSVKVINDTSAIEMDGKCLRQKCEEDPALGYALMKRFALTMSERLKATRMQVIDVYGKR